MHHPDMSIDLVAASASDAGLIGSLLDEYLSELSRHRDVSTGATNSASYSHLDAYWSEEGRNAFIIQCGGHIVGFALIRGPVSTGSPAYQLAEFYIKPDSRGLGIGLRSALGIWKRLPGQWELRVHARNEGAVQFWAASAKASRTRGTSSQLRTTR